LAFFAATSKVIVFLGTTFSTVHVVAEAVFLSFFRATRRLSSESELTSSGTASVLLLTHPIADTTGIAEAGASIVEVLGSGVMVTGSAVKMVVTKSVSVVFLYITVRKDIQSFI